VPLTINSIRSYPQGEIGFLSDIRRMTRARRKLLLVGDSSTLCRHPLFVELLAYVKGVGATAMRMRWASRLESVMVIVAKMARDCVFNGSRVLSSDKGSSFVARTLKAS
jgi:hypothetical protein